MVNPDLGSTSVVRNLHDCFKWMDHCIGQLHRHLGEERFEAATQSLLSSSVSISFSGIGTPEYSRTALLHALASFTGNASLATKAKASHADSWACELEAESRYELMMQDLGPRHVYGDINGFIHIGFQEDLMRNGSRLNYDDMLRMFRSTYTKLISRKAWCYRCSAYCTAVRCVLHVAGTPCIAWSTMGTRCGASGPTLLCFMVWAFQRLLIQEDAVLHENTPEFNSDLLLELLQEFYIVSSLVKLNTRTHLM